MKKILIVLVVLILIVPVLVLAQQAPAKSEDAQVLEKIARTTGMSLSQVNGLTAKPEDILMAYVIGIFTGNNAEGILKSCGADFKKYAQEHSIDTARQALIDARFAKLKSKIWQPVASRGDYSNIDKDLALERISNRTGVSKGDIDYYGFGGGIDSADILLAAEISQKTGNRFSDIIYAKKNGTWEDVWAKYCPDTLTQAAINSKRSADTAYCLPPKAGGGNRSKVSLTPAMEQAAEVIANETGSYKAKILDYLKDGEQQADVVKALVVAMKTGNDVYNIMKMKNEKGWEKVYSTYVMSKAAEVDAKVGRINAKITAALAAK